MKASRALLLGVVASLAVHLGAALSPGWSSDGDGEGKGAVRLVAQVRSASESRAAAEDMRTQAQAAGTPKKTVAKPSVPKSKTPLVPPPGAAVAQLPPEPANSASASIPDPAALPEEKAPMVTASEPVTELALANGASAGVGSGSSESSSLVAVSAASKLPKDGRVRYLGSASLLAGEGEVEWTHNGAQLRSRLAAGVRGLGMAFTYESTNNVTGPLVVSEKTNDNRRGKASEATIDLAAGTVTQQRGDDTRTKTISGAAVALSALPQLLAVLDESLVSASLFIVGDFWVEDATILNKGEETLNLESLRVRTRHYQSRTKDGKLIDIWLAPEWKNAPARIRIEAGAVIDLKAVEVEVDGQIFLGDPAKMRPLPT